MTTPVLEARGLSRRYGKTTALDHLNISVPPGIVLGLLGDNGAGKSTLMRMALGLLTPTGGELSVLGLDPRRQGPQLRARLGYVPEDRRLYRHMRVLGILKYARSLQPRWNVGLANDLVARFELDPTKKIGALSRGGLAKLYLLLALAHEPELLVLDEATGGIDALARRDILAMLVERVADTGMSVIFASHVIGDVERVADRVAVLHQGHLLADHPLDELRERFALLRVTFADEAPEPPDLAAFGALEVERRRREWEVLSADAGATRRQLEQVTAGSAGATIEALPLALEDVFIGLIKSRRELAGVGA